MRALLGVLVVVACAPQPEAPPPPVEVAPPPAPPPPPPRDVALADGLTLGDPLRAGALILTPILADTPATDAPLTLDDGLARGLVTVREPGGSIDDDGFQTLIVRNRSTRTLLVLSGELLDGGYQDRAIGATLTIPPRTTVPVTVFCVEKARSEGASPRFRSPGAIASLSIRRAMAKSQSQVWSDIDLEHVRHAAIDNPTRSYVHVVEAVAPRIAAARAALLDRLDDAPHAVGLVVTLGGEVVAIDLFDAPATLRAYAPKLVASYLRDALAAPVETRAPTAAEVRAALGSPAPAPYTGILP